MLFFLLPSCRALDERNVSGRDGASLVGRMITPELWSGGSGGTRGQREGRSVVIRGPIDFKHPVDGRAINAFERIAMLNKGRRRQVLTVTQDGAGLGRVLDQQDGLPERIFAEDIIFPLGVWRQGEVRRFEATEYTPFGPAKRLLTLEILDIDHVHKGVARSLSYRLTIRDEAGRVLNCDVSVYSPGRGLVEFRASGGWQGCSECPCKG